MLKVQEYLQTKTTTDLTTELGIKVNKHESLPLMILNYDQIDSPKTNPIVRECRALVLNSDTNELVAKSFNRFFNWGEVQDEMKLFNFNDFTATTKEDGCFPYETRLSLWNGGSEKIGKIVNNKLCPTLIGMDENGNLVPNKVTNWFHNGLKTNWMNIFVTLSNVNGSLYSCEHKINVTTNHSIYLNDTFQLAINAKSGDYLTSFRQVPSSSVLHLIKSSLLGDGSLSWNYKNARFTDGHKIEHNQYNEFINGWLGECAAKQKNRTSGFGTKMIDNISKTYSSLNELRKLWYPNDVKTIPEDLSWMDDFSFAKWYMDDGCLSSNDSQEDRAIISTDCFSQESVEKLIVKLKQFYGVDAKIGLSKDKYFFIRINHSNGTINKFWKSIAPHIIPCMRYKLPEEYRSENYIEYPLGKEEKIKVCNPISKIEFIQTKKVGYDISTETHNYFANGNLVHNSLCLIFNFNDQWFANTRGSFATDLMQFTDITWQHAFCQAMNVNNLNELKLNKELSYVCEFTSPYNKVVRTYKTPQMYLLTAFKGENELKQTDVDNLANPHFLRPKYHSYKNIDEIEFFLRECVKSDPTFEGVVIWDGNNRWKVKNTSYISLHKMRGEGDNLYNPKNLLPFILAGEGDELLTYFEEVRETFFKFKAIVDEAIQGMNELWQHTKNIESQKEFALKIIKHPLSSILFEARKKNVDPKDIIKDHEALILKKLFKE